MAKENPGRRLKAQQTRNRMLEAAMALFVEHGYGGTTIESIAGKAGVAVQTIYFSFGNKQRILKELIDVHIAGDENPVPTLERPQVIEALEAEDPRQQLRLQVHLTRVVLERVGPLLEVLRNAAATSGDGAELWEANKSQRLVVQRRFVESLESKGALREGLGVDRAVDISYVLLGPELFHLLVTERGWSMDEWEQWVFDSHCQHLIGEKA
ncbi:TetR family transcriptional regulator [Streptomyces spiroverticillatus]|uniref:TetR family transcriptional regulator n=1 Tax=Streptomyces finlayi TaxID=67296 RepID=A0A918X8G5_9ACTN|nr:TetR family transcriptional regulator [Streptomyces finlayi]GHA44173.1 TetR family transcriptional regulator [Streptomyces spiroverticillatus]GHD17671.1 TetR family transcriptional regulator [Streptomyces finlayi]